MNTWLPVTAAVAVVALFVLLAPAWRRRTLRRRRRSLGGPLIVIERENSPSTADGTTGDPAAGRAGNTAGHTAGSTAADIPDDLVTDPSAVAVARQDAHQAWAELLDTMIDFSVPVDEAETPRATVNRLVDLPTLVPVRSSADLLARAEERASYAPDTGTDAGTQRCRGGDPGGAGRSGHPAAAVERDADAALSSAAVAVGLGGLAWWRDRASRPDP